jgi:SAM-dependent methyltransferase
MVRELGAHPSHTLAVQCAAEALPFAPAGFDAVTVATAFHWFDASRALPEIARVLRSGGRLALTWNTRDESVAWVRRLGDLLRSVQPVGLTGDWGTGSVTQLRSSPLFDALDRSEFSFTQLVDRDGLLALVVSRSYVQALAPPERQRLLADVSTLFDETAAVTSTGDHGAHLRLPYRSQCWRATVT